MFDCAIASGRPVPGGPLISRLASDLADGRLDAAGPAPAWFTTPTRAAQYTAVLFTKRCQAAGIEVSMGSKGDCFDTQSQLLLSESTGPL